MPQTIPTRIWVDKAYKNCQSGTWHALEAVAVQNHKEYVAAEGAVEKIAGSILAYAEKDADDGDGTLLDILGGDLKIDVGMPDEPNLLDSHRLALAKKIAAALGIGK